MILFRNYTYTLPPEATDFSYGRVLILTVQALGRIPLNRTLVKHTKYYQGGRGMLSGNAVLYSSP